MPKAFIPEARLIIKLGIPLIISHMAIIGMAATDTVVSGLVSTVDLAGLSVAASIWAALSVFILGMCGATATIVAHLHGGGRFTRIGFQVHQTGWIGLCTAIVASIILLSSRWWLPAIQPAGPVTAIATGYLSIITYGCFGFVITAVLQNACEAVGDTGLAMITNLLLFGVNAVLDYLLVFGQFGLPRLGAIGCAWASVVAYWLVAFGLTLYLVLRKDYRRYHLFTKAWQPHWKSLKQHLSLGIPLAIGSGGEVFFFSSVALMLAPFGAVSVAGHQVVLNYGALVYMIPLGLSVALCIRVAQLRGSRRQADACFSAFTGVKITLGVAVITAALTLFGRDWIAGLYSPDPGVQTIAAKLLLMCALYQFFDAVQVSSWGGLRGFGDVKVPMLMQLTAYWLCGFPLGAFFAHWLELGVYGFWWGIICGLFIAAVLLHSRLWVITRR